MVRRMLILVAVSLLAAAFCAPSAFAVNKSLEERIAALEAQVVELTQTVSTLSSELVAVQQADKDLRSDLNLVFANPVLDLGQYVSVKAEVMNDVRGPNIVFSGANVHVLSANDEWGLGNLIIGPNLKPAEAQETGYRSGRNCLVVGNEHSFSANGGFVAGFSNKVIAPASSVSGGGHNVADGEGCSVSGGWDNTAGDSYSSVSGGYNNNAVAHAASISGGWGHTANGVYSSISGGEGNTAGGYATSISGGGYNSAWGEYATVSGGTGVSLDGRHQWAAGVVERDASTGENLVPAFNQQRFLSPLVSRTP